PTEGRGRARRARVRPREPLRPLDANHPQEEERVMSTRIARRTAFAPWSPFPDLESRLERMLGQALPGREGSGLWMPAVNLKETDDAYLLTGEFPGMKEEDV